MDLARSKLTDHRRKTTGRYFLISEYRLDLCGIPSLFRFGVDATLPLANSGGIHLIRPSEAGLHVTCNKTTTVTVQYKLVKIPHACVQQRFFKNIRKLSTRRPEADVRIRRVRKGHPRSGYADGIRRAEQANRTPRMDDYCLKKIKSFIFLLFAFLFLVLFW